MTGRMQVLVDGEWVDVGGAQTLEGFTAAEPIVDEVQQMPTSFSMTVPLAPESAATLMRFMRGRALAERANRRLWLRHPYRMRGLHHE